MILTLTLKLKDTTKSCRNQALLTTTISKIRDDTFQDKLNHLKHINMEISIQISIMNRYLQTTEPVRNHSDDSK